jgi:hypothetical protein
MDDSTHQQLVRAHRTAVVIGLALMLANFVYVGIAQIMKLTANPKPFTGLGAGVPIGIMRWVFIAISLSFVPLIGILREQVLKGKTRLRPSGISPLVQRLVTAHVLTFGLCDAIGIFGLLLFLLAANDLDLYGFIGSALLLELYHFPRLTDWERWLHDATGD